MASFKPDPALYRSLQDKVIVLTGSLTTLRSLWGILKFQGGANGIGAAIVRLFAQRGALILFGDLDVASGEKLAAEYDPERVHFLKTDVTKYDENVALFRRALDKYGRVDHAFSVAGILEQGNIFDPALTIEDVAKVHDVLTYTRIFV